jgi:hypothetical protein
MNLPEKETSLSESGEMLDDIADLPKGEVLDRVDPGTIDKIEPDTDEIYNDDSVLKWLIPLILVALLVIIGYWFCGKSTP